MLIYHNLHQHHKDLLHKQHQKKQLKNILILTLSNIAGQGTSYKALDRDIKALGGLEASKALRAIQKNQNISKIPGVVAEIGIINNLPQQQKIQKTTELISAIRVYVEDAKTKRQAEIDKERAELQAGQTELEENLHIQEAGEENEPKGIQFEFPLTGELWAQVEEKDLVINLGDPERYNKQMLDVSQEVNSHFSYISLIFKKAKELNINITRYFATSVKAQQAARAKENNNQGYGRRAIDNANEISSTMEKVISIRKGQG